MNVGYSKNNVEYRKNNKIGVEDLDKCPICRSDIYGSKRGINFRCMSDGCVLSNGGAIELRNKINEVLKSLEGDD